MHSRQHTGVLIALVIIILWFATLATGLTTMVDYTSPWLYLLILVQTHLYTGLFITAHDAMHGTISTNKRLNTTLGHITALLFSYNFYHRLFPKHHEHHRFVATEKDPDYHKGSFFPWYLSFLKQYISWQQIVLMAITFNLLKLIFPVENLILLWMLPGVLATFQLFYFGTYLPHKGHHSDKNRHFSRSQSKNHLWAFLTCYFFGYHYEHHDSPATPWWRLYKKKEEQQLKGYPE
ncbi:MAG: fatty acid desaturase [Roseivirga sp.]|nr:fatty acid desaturase [Roseivirga sp.]